jgi:hypothetical protein
LKHQIPIKTDHWDVDQPGYLEIDLVSHSGASASGEFLHTLDGVDIQTCWVERQAVRGKGHHGVVQAMTIMEQQLPFPLRGIDSDNGSEFINEHLWAFCQRPAGPAIQFTRARPYKKDDNAHVEQKNWTWARQLLGYGRLEDPELVVPISALYREVWAPWQNFFLPCLKLEKKWRQGSHWRKRYEPPKTAYERWVRARRPIRRKSRPCAECWRTDPFALSPRIDQQLERLYRVARQSGPEPRAAHPFSALRLARVDIQPPGPAACPGLGTAHGQKSGAHRWLRSDDHQAGQGRGQGKNGSPRRRRPR